MTSEPAGARYTFPVTVIGDAASRAVTEGGSGAVLAVFRRSFYVACGDGRLACFGPPSLQEGPLNGLCRLPEGLDWAASGLRTGLPARLSGDVLRVGERFRFPLAGARRWRPDAPPPGWARRDLARGLRSLLEATAHSVPPRGLGVLIPALCEPSAAPEGSALADPVLRAAWPGAVALRAWLAAALSGEQAAVPADVARLVGLGEGLTPSGDDYIGGALVALNVIGRQDVAARLSTWALPLAREGTGRISAAHLACAAAGEGNAALHHVLSALLAAGAPDLVGRLEAVDAIGHSSGWDALAGAVAACAAFCAGSGEPADDR